MRKNLIVMAAVALAGTLLLGAAPMGQTSQDILAHYVSLDVASKKSEAMAKALLMDEAQRNIFWPVYDAYQRELALSSNERESLLNEYVKDAATIDDAKAKVLIARGFEMQERRAALLKKYAGELEQKLPGKLVLKFVQVELQLQHLRDLQVSSQLPDLR